MTRKKLERRVLAEGRMASLLAPYLEGYPEQKQPAALLERLGVYLDLLTRWSSRTNLTSIRDEETIVRRHFGESLFAGSCLERLGHTAGTLLDLGSGAGFPGLPIALLLPDLRVTLAESQGKKAAFLRDAVRALGVTAEVWGARVEQMPASRTFEVVTLRAVDRMAAMVEVGRERVRAGGLLLSFTSSAEPGSEEWWPVPGTEQTVVRAERC